MSIEFAEHLGVYTGTSAGGRQWRITEVRTGWRMEFRDRGDTDPTNAGVYRSVDAAQAEAGRVSQRGRSHVRGRPT